MNFLKKKQQKIIVSDQTNGSKLSLSSGDKNETHLSPPDAEMKREASGESAYTSTETVELKSKSSVKKKPNAAGAKQKHAHFSNKNDTVHVAGEEDMKTTQYSLDEVLPKSNNVAMIGKSTGVNMLRHINEESVGVTEENSKHIMPLYSCVIRGDKNELKKLINAHPELLNLSDNFGRTPLMYCVLADRLDCAKVLLKIGCSIDQVDNAGRGALHLAAHKGSYKFVELLHSKGATLDMKDEDGQTPIHLSTRNRSAKCLEFLLRNIGSGMADVCDKQKRTALHWSAAFNNSECCRLLIKYGCNIAIPDDAGKTPLHWAANNQDPSAVNIMKMLLNNVPSLLNWQDYEGRTALHFAVADGNDAAVEFLINFEALECDVNRSDNTFRTQLHWATQLGHVHVVKLLLQSGAKNSMTDSNGAQPLLYAALNNHADVVAAMIDNDPTVVEQADLEGRNSLMWAAGKGSNAVIRVLLGLPAADKSKSEEPLRSNGNTQPIEILNVNHENLSGSSPNVYKHPKIKFSPVDINRVDNNQNTALHFAAINGQASSVELLLSQGAQHNLRNDQNHTAIFGACEKGHLNAVKYLLDYNACITEVDVRKRSPLHWAALGGHDEVCELLIKEGLDVDIRDSMERTPLHCAAFGGFINCMNLLLEHGANVDAQDDQGLSALHWAADFGHIDAVRLLFQYNVFLNPMEYTEERLTPLDHALANDHDEIIQYLIEKNALSAEAIRVYAAKRIQACYRGYQVRKTFLKQKEILLQHKNQMLKREQKKDRFKIQKLRETESYDTLEKPMLNSSLLSVATSMDGRESMSTSVAPEPATDIASPEPITNKVHNEDNSSLMESNLSKHDTMLTQQHEVTAQSKPSFADFHDAVFESLKGLSEDSSHRNNNALKHEPAPTVPKAVDDVTQLKPMKTRSKEERPKIPNKSYTVPTNCFPDIGNENNIKSERTNGLAYKSVHVDKPAINDRNLHEYNMVVESQGLSLSLYIESIMKMSPAKRKALAKLQRDRKNMFIVANKSAAIIQRCWRRYCKKNGKIRGKRNAERSIDNKTKHKVHNQIFHHKPNNNNVQTTKDLKKKSTSQEEKIQSNPPVPRRPKSHKESNKSHRVFDVVTVDIIESKSSTKRRLASAKVAPQALSAMNSPRRISGSYAKEKRNRSSDIGTYHNKQSYDNKIGKTTSKSIAELPLKWQHLYSDGQSESSKSGQSVRKTSAKFSYNLGKLS